MTLSRFPVEVCQNYGLTWRHRERRGCLHTDLLLPGNIVLHLFNVHLGTSFVERLHQVHMLLGNHVLSHTQWAGPRIVVVDFNEWTLAWPRDLWGKPSKQRSPRPFCGTVAPIRVFFLFFTSIISITTNTVPC